MSQNRLEKQLRDFAFTWQRLTEEKVSLFREEYDAVSAYNNSFRNRRNGASEEEIKAEQERICKAIFFEENLETLFSRFRHFTQTPLSKSGNQLFEFTKEKGWTAIDAEKKSTEELWNIFNSYDGLLKKMEYLEECALPKVKEILETLNKDWAGDNARQKNLREADEKGTFVVKKLTAETGLPQFIEHLEGFIAQGKRLARTMERGATGKSI